MLLRGVRSSWDMLARNSDLYLEAKRQLRRLFLQGMAGLFDLPVLALDLGILLAPAVGLCFPAPRWSAAAPFAALAARSPVSATVAASPSVRIVASMVFSTMPMLSVNCERKVRCVEVNSAREASSTTALV